MSTPRPTVPVIRLDPDGHDHHGEAAVLRAAGPVVQVILPGEIRAWAVTTHALVADLVTHTDVSKDSRRWTAMRNGDIPDDWPLRGMFDVNNMVTRDGEDHRRLRKPIADRFTPRRAKELTPRIERIVATLLDTLPALAGEDGVLDLRRHYALPVPMQVICEIVGVPDGSRPYLRQLVDSIFRTDTTPDEAQRTERERVVLLDDLITERSTEPCHDLTSDLLALHAADPALLSREELRDTLWLLLTAGHETTLGLICNAIRALLTHPDQLHVALTGDQDTIWARVVEETLRQNSSIGNFPAYYPLTDLTLGEVTIPVGEAILAPYSAVGRDPAHHGPHADEFDITRTKPAAHLAFGGGPHRCLGAHLARAETTAALRGLFTRYPDLTLAAPADQLVPVASLFSNTVAALPVRLSASRER
ncbi:MAG TPA: cytochrome P450 [Pseudonocardiaceae bacterium]|jgi:cytochrome P450